MGTLSDLAVMSPSPNNHTDVEEMEFKHKDVPSIISIGQSVELADTLKHINTAKMKWNNYEYRKKRSIRTFFVYDPIRKHFRAFSCKESRQT